MRSRNLSLLFLTLCVCCLPTTTVALFMIFAVITIVEHVRRVQTKKSEPGAGEAVGEYMYETQSPCDSNGWLGAFWCKLCHPDKPHWSNLACAWAHNQITLHGDRDTHKRAKRAYEAKKKEEWAAAEANDGSPNEVGGSEGGIGIGVAAVFDGLARVVGTGVGIARVDGVGGTIGAPARLGGLSTGAGGGRP